MKVVLLGSSGQLGCDLVRALADWDLVPLTHADLDVRDDAAVRGILTGIRPHAVINATAFHRTDECEEHPEKAFAVNTYAVRNLAHVCADLDATLVHVSTDYVFGGERHTPYREDDAPGPLSVYGISKLAGEYFVRALCSRYFIVRTSGLYGAAGTSGKGGNFVESMLRLAQEGRHIRVVDDQVLTPTYTRDLALKMKELVPTEAYGLYHITNDGQCSWYEFASKIFALLGLQPDLGPTTTAAFGARARRPAYSVLARDRLEKLRRDDLRPWAGALNAYLREKGYLAS